MHPCAGSRTQPVLTLNFKLSPLWHPSRTQLYLPPSPPPPQPPLPGDVSQLPHCSCLKERAGRERKGFNSSFIWGFCLNFCFIDNSCPKGNPVARILLAQPSEMQRLGAAVDRKIPPNPTDRGHNPSTAQWGRHPTCTPLTDTCQSP